MSKWCAVSRAGAMVAIMLSVCGAQPGMLTTLADGGVTVPHSTALVPTGGFTIEAWFYLDPSSPVPGGYSSIARKDRGGYASLPSYLFRVLNPNGGPLQLEYHLGSGGFHTLTAPTPTPVNAWHHAAATYDGTHARLYLDAVLIAQMIQPGVLSAGGYGILRLADGHGTDTDSWKGSLDNIRIWSVARTASELASTMNYELPGEPGVVAEWQFNFDYLDSTGQHHGTGSSAVGLFPSTSPVIGHYLTAPSIAPIGSPLQYDLRIGTASPYIFDISGSGTSPGTAIPGVGTIPLNRPFLNFDYGAALPPGLVQGFSGVAAGPVLVHPVLNVPLDPTLVGLQLHASFVLLDPMGPFGVGFIGNAAATTVVGPGPSILTVSPNTSPQSGGWPITIAGNHFQGGAQVTVGGAAALNVVVVDPQTITCDTPPGNLGPADVTVVNPDALSSTLLGGVTYVEDLALTSVAPVPAASGALVVITGTGFQPGLSLDVGGINVVPSSVTSSSVTYVNPPAVPCGAHVTVTNPDSQTGSLPVNPDPTITQLMPPTTPAIGGSTFFIVGSNFFAGSTVIVGGTPATVNIVNEGVIAVTAPPGTPGPAAVVVATPSGCAATATLFYQ